MEKIKEYATVSISIYAGTPYVDTKDGVKIFVGIKDGIEYKDEVKYIEDRKSGVEYPNKITFSMAVNKMIADGWQPLDGAILMNDDHLVQTMVKY